MWELERKSDSDTPACTRLAIVGQGRLGTALARALAGFAPSRSDGSDRPLGSHLYDVAGPLGRGASCEGADAVLLCVPDAEIAAAASLIAPGPLVGHCSGATGIDALAPRESFGMHPLMTVTAGGARFGGAGSAIAGTSPRALAFAQELARALGMRPFLLAETDRAAYHAAASIASNFLITLEAAAERLATTTGMPRELLAPLVRATVENLVELGPERALTGPVARGDEATVRRQRRAVAARAPELLELFDSMVVATRKLAAGKAEQAA
jgi:predicted short-subunit dehydrogenase-like oxidoreductase (DUF2520 family)